MPWTRPRVDNQAWRVSSPNPRGVFTGVPLCAGVGPSHPHRQRASRGSCSRLAQQKVSTLREPSLLRAHSPACVPRWSLIYEQRKMNSVWSQSRPARSCNGSCDDTTPKQTNKTKKQQPQRVLMLSLHLSGPKRMGTFWTTFWTIESECESDPRMKLLAWAAEI